MNGVWSLLKNIVIVLVALSLVGCGATGTTQNVPQDQPAQAPEPATQQPPQAEVQTVANPLQDETPEVAPVPEPPVEVPVGTPVPVDMQALSDWGLTPETEVTVVPLPENCVGEAITDDGIALAFAAVAARNVTINNLVPAGLSANDACLAYVGHQLLRRAAAIPLLYQGVVKLMESGPELLAFNGNHGAAKVTVAGQIIVYIFGSASLLTSFTVRAERISTLLPKADRMVNQPAALRVLFDCMKRAFDSVRNDSNMAERAKQLADRLYRDNSAHQFSLVAAANAGTAEIPAANYTVVASEQLSLSVPAEFQHLTTEEIHALVILGVIVLVGVGVTACVVSGCTLLVFAPAVMLIP